MRFSERCGGDLFAWMIAEGLTVESYLDTGNSAFFENAEPASDGIRTARGGHWTAMPPPLARNSRTTGPTEAAKSSAAWHKMLKADRERGKEKQPVDHDVSTLGSN